VLAVGLHVLGVECVAEEVLARVGAVRTLGHNHLVGLSRLKAPLGATDPMPEIEAEIAFWALDFIGRPTQAPGPGCGGRLPSRDGSSRVMLCVPRTSAARRRRRTRLPTPRALPQLACCGGASAEGFDGGLRLPALEDVDLAGVDQVGGDGEVEAAASLFDNVHAAREV
jgi:hypothetical protein